MLASEAKILHKIKRVASVYCRIDYQTVMRSCYKPGKILPNARWERTSPERRRIWKMRLSERGTTRPQSLPSAVFRSIR